MPKVTKANQINPPLPKKKRVDSQGNDRKRVFAKSGTATLMIAENLTENAANVFISNMKTNAERLGGTLKCTLIITR